VRAWRAFKKSFLLLSVYVDKIAMGNMGVKQAETSNVWVWERTLAARLLLPCWHVYLLVWFSCKKMQKVFVKNTAALFICIW